MKCTEAGSATGHGTRDGTVETGRDISMGKTINKIIIVGGGTAGWMTASTLVKCFPGKEIWLIESPNISTVGVGESTLGQIRGWQALLGIRDEDFMPACDATYKLSIKFTDFYKKGESFHYPFGMPYLEGNHSGLNDWWYKKFLYPETPYSDYASCNWGSMALVNENRCFHNIVKNDDYRTDGALPFRFRTDTAFQFDATKFGLWLRDNFCIPRGLKHVKEEIKTVEQDEDGIKTLNGQYEADLFIDCTGFKSLLLGKTLEEPFVNLEDTLPNNTAWCTHIPYTDKRKQVVGYTNCTAVENGWIWNIPLWSRIGCGYVYSDKFISDDDALVEFQKHIGTKELDFKKIKFRTGHQRRLWVKNVCAIGLAAGFIEPLESNGLFSIHEFIHELIRTLQRGPVSQWDKDAFTSVCKLVYYSFYEFLVMHYALSHRQDTPYWRSNFNKQWSKNLFNMVPDQYRGFKSAIQERGLDHHFTNPKSGLHAIAAGMHWSPTDMPTLIKSNLVNEANAWKNEFQPIVNRLNKRKHEWEKVAKKAPIMYDFLKKKFYG